MVVYLFLFGKLVDAYQSRSMSHLKRAGIALHTKIFMEYWLQFLDKAGYVRRCSCLSNNAIDITRYLINGLLGLIFIHRDYCDETLPLLPWLHSSETCKHFFGVACQITPDFTFGDLFNMSPKLHLKLRIAATRGRSTDGKERANGYNHTYFDADNTKLKSLATFSTNTELENAAHQAHNKAQELFFLSGINPAQLTNDTPVLPGIESFFFINDRNTNHNGGEDSDEDSDHDDESDSGNEYDYGHSNAKLLEI